MNDHVTKAFLSKDVTTGSMAEWKSLRYLARFAKPWKWRFFGAFLLLASASVLTMVSAYLLGRLVDEGLLSANHDSIMFYAITLLCCEMISVVAIYYGRRVLARSASYALYRVREAMFMHMQALPLSYYDREPQGRTVTRMTHDVEDLENFFTMSAGRLGMSMLLIINCMIAMLFTYLTLGLIIMISMIPALVVTVKSRVLSRKLHREMAAKNSSINARLAEFIEGHSVIRSFGLETWSREQFDRRVNSYFDTCIEVNRFNSMIRPTTDLLCAFPLLCLVWFGGGMVLDGVLSLGLLVTFVRYCDQFFRPISQLSREIHVVQQAFTSMDRVSHFLRAATENEVLGDNGDVLADSIEGSISFDDVSLRYGQDGDFVLKELSFEIQPGETIGLLGRTGSGKTSTVSILTRLYEFQCGTVSIDDVSIRDFDRSSLRDAIGFVSQDVTIFRGTVYDNLNVNRRYSEQEVARAARKTGLQKVLHQGDMTLDSELLDKGDNISVGERQLIALTRILLKSPRVLILDEATANIDPELEKIIHDAVDVVMEDRTCLIIAHRLETLKSCDRLFVFKDGSIVEQGPHDELFKQEGYYHQLITSNDFGVQLNARRRPGA